jgi:Lar family restriction alleviation protein
MTDDSNLAPCPFCGEDRFLSVKGGVDPGQVSWVECGTCFTEGPTAPTKEAAERRWNERQNSG